MKERAGIQSVEVGFALLDVLGQSAGPLMLRDLAAAAGMSAAKAHRYLVSFQRLQLVVQDAGTTRYDLGPAALKLGLPVTLTHPIDPSSPLWGVSLEGLAARDVEVLAFLDGTDAMTSNALQVGPL